MTLPRSCGQETRPRSRGELGMVRKHRAGAGSVKVFGFTPTHRAPWAAFPLPQAPVLVRPWPDRAMEQPVLSSRHSDTLFAREVRSKNPRQSKFSQYLKH
jgi:hypothetical protein